MKGPERSYRQLHRSTSRVLRTPREVLGVGSEQGAQITEAQRQIYRDLNGGQITQAQARDLLASGKPTKIPRG